LKFDWDEMSRISESNESEEQSKLVKLESWYKVKNMIPVSNNAIERIIDYVKIEDVNESETISFNRTSNNINGEDEDDLI
jgi:hypothetical protein